jgi:eukaryotic-like serine/threonine-protein kinase
MADRHSEPSLTGRRIAHYEVADQIGAGGMGQVYRAKDTKLGRYVAIKVLPPSLSSDPSRRGRFEQEARALAALNHPNIAAIYGFENEHDSCALVLELVEGPTLEERLTKGQLPLKEALRIARQIADGLEAAHERDIAHRDLKPANIKISRNGIVKVLDFGLAKALSAEAPTPSHAAFQTTQGIVVGTPAYMSPEQATGQTTDQATDIWAFGCVLFEMLAGRRAFPGDSSTEIIGSVLSREPNWDLLPADVPENVRRLLRHCLDKDPRRRMHHIADARLELDDLLETSTITTASRPQKSTRLLWPAVGGAVLLGVLGAYFLNMRPAIPNSNERPETSTIVEKQITTNPIEDPVVFAAISPDGKYVAYNDSTAIRIRLIDTGETRTLSVPPEFCFR